MRRTSRRAVMRTKNVPSVTVRRRTFARPFQVNERRTRLNRATSRWPRIVRPCEDWKTATRTGAAPRGENAMRNPRRRGLAVAERKTVLAAHAFGPDEPGALIAV